MLNKKRNFFSTRNKYEAQIVLLVFFPCLLLFLCFSGIVTLMTSEMARVLFSSPPSALVQQFYQWNSLIVSALCIIFILALIFSFILSRNLVGAFGRMIKELDEIIAGRSKKLITARPRDELANALLQRINVLIQNYIENKR